MRRRRFLSVLSLSTAAAQTPATPQRLLAGLMPDLNDVDLRYIAFNLASTLTGRDGNAAMADQGMSPPRHRRLYLVAISPSFGSWPNTGATYL